MRPLEFATRSSIKTFDLLGVCLRLSEISIIGFWALFEESLCFLSLLLFRYSHKLLNTIKIDFADINR
jgi:hypothetical protein